MKKRFFVWAGMLGSMLLSGCLTMQPTNRRSTDEQYMSNLYGKKAREEASEMSMNLKFEDIPIPAGFDLDYKESFVFSNGVSQVGILRYIGRADLTSLTTFFKSQMPMYNWEMIVIVEYKRVILNFEKETQTCTIILEPLGGRVIITIASGPIGQ